MFILKNWSVVKRRRESGEELVCLCGRVYGNPRFGTGQVITTSFIKSHRLEADLLVVGTRNGSEYTLGRPRATEVFAKQRLLRHLRQAGVPTSFDDTAQVTDISGLAGQVIEERDDATRLDCGSV